MTDLVTLAQAKTQVRITDTNSDVDLDQLVTDASLAVVAYCDPLVTPWTIDTVPSNVARAVLLVLAAMYEDREGLDDPLGPGPLSLLRPYRTPTLS
jgi:hypothetical protein